MKVFQEVILYHILCPKVKDVQLLLPHGSQSILISGGEGIPLSFAKKLMQGCLIFQELIALRVYNGE